MLLRRTTKTRCLTLLLIGLPVPAVFGQEGPNSSLYSGQQMYPIRPTSVRYQPVEDPDVNSPAPSSSQPPAIPAPLPTPGYGAGMYGGAPMSSGWYEIPLPPPREAKVNDIITIRVDLGSRVTSEGEFQRRKNASYDAILKDWLLLDGLRSVKPAPQSDGDQRIQGSLNSLTRTQADLETSEAIKFDIAAKVVSILPNGTLVLEAHREIRNNNETWLASLSGVCRREDIQPGNVVLSKDIAELKIDKREVGAIRDSYRRGWFTRWLDRFNPF